MAEIVQNEIQEYKHPRRNSPDDVFTVETHGQFSCGMPPEVNDTSGGDNDIVVGMEDTIVVPTRHDAKHQIKSFSPVYNLSSENSGRSKIIINCRASCGN